MDTQGIPVWHEDTKYNLEPSLWISLQLSWELVSLCSDRRWQDQHCHAFHSSGHGWPSTQAEWQDWHQSIQNRLHRTHESSCLWNREKFLEKTHRLWHTSQRADRRHTSHQATNWRDSGDCHDTWEVGYRYKEVWWAHIHWSSQAFDHRWDSPASWC